MKKTTQQDEELSLEQAFEQIEEVISHLESEEITLEQSFQEYNKGMQLLKRCNETIDKVHSLGPFTSLSMRSYI